MTDRNEALAQLPHKLATLIRSLPQAPFRAHLSAECVKQAERIAGLEGERDQHKHTATSLLSLLADIRMACGDNGKRMQPELVEFIGAMKAERDQLRAEVERLRAAMTVPTIEPNSQNWQGMDGAIAFHLIERHADSWSDAGRMMSEWLEANAARTHKETE